MNRSGYGDDIEGLKFAQWRGQVASAIRGKRGQAFLRELIAALDAMPDKRLIRDDLQRDGEVCAIGSVGLRRGIDLKALDPEDYDAIAAAFGIAHQLVQEIEWVNDECAVFSPAPGTLPERRWQYVRDWATKNLRP